MFDSIFAQVLYPDYPAGMQVDLSTRRVRNMNQAIRTVPLITPSIFQVVTSDISLTLFNI
jgi:hypothetical protein